MARHPREQEDDDEPAPPSSGLLERARTIAAGFFSNLRRQLRKVSYRDSEDDDWDEETFRERQARFEQDAAALSEIVGELYEQLDQMRVSMRRAYAASTLRQRAHFLATVADSFIEIKRNRKDPLYHFVHHTPEREAALEQVIETALDAAQRFEEYSEDPESFSQVMARSSIKHVLVALQNLDPIS